MSRTCETCKNYEEYPTASKAPKYSFSANSKLKLSTIHPDLQKLANAVIKNYDCSVVCGFRGEMAQNQAFEDKKSKVKWPDGAHNQMPSNAIDLAPYIAGKGISWNIEQCYNFAGYVQATADFLGIEIIWGGDWDSDRDVNDQNFNDLVHFELA